MFAKYLRSELFRISKMYSTYVLIGVLFVCTLLSTFMTTNIDYASVMGVSDEELAEVLHNAGGNWYLEEYWLKWLQQEV